MRGASPPTCTSAKGILTQPSQLTFALWFLRSNISVLLPLWALIVMFVMWWTKGRDPEGRHFRRSHV